jgi:hypothetical protein
MPMHEDFAGLPPLSLYIHTVVRAKVSVLATSIRTMRRMQYHNRIRRRTLLDLDQDFAAAQGRPLTSIFFGGGT